MRNFLTTLCVIFMIGISLYSQEIPVKSPPAWKSYIHLESGYIYPSGTIKESIAIRQNISSYFVNQSANGEITSETSGFIMGLRWEYFNEKLKSGISTGVRYTGYGCEISGYSSNNADFFYLRYSMLNSDTKFARVKGITETNHFISIPLEVRIIPFQMKGLGLFVKAGTEISRFNLKKTTNINFQDKNMENQEDIILNNIGVSSNKLYSTLYGSVGVKLGYENKPNYIFEVFLPSLFLTKNNFTLIDVVHFEGFKFSVQFPVN